MARPTDVERGARIALAISQERIAQPDLFGDTLPVEFWRAIELEASVTLAECIWARDVACEAMEANVRG